VFERLAVGDEVALPNFGLETVHHVHADDVAQAFERAMDNWAASVGENFHVVSPAAITLRGYAGAVSEWFGRSPTLTFLAWPEWRATVSDEDANWTLEHITHSPNCSAAKAERLIGYKPRYTSLQAVHESLDWLIADGRVGIAK
jgi:nucleoside-diphosphate-sugar epimerase